MSTGACGVNCTVCRLHVEGLCSTCGSGTSQVGKDKLEAQLRLFGKGCAFLQCAVDRRIAYCLRDCEDFPCDLHMSEDYPFGKSFLQMQQRRRELIGPKTMAAWPENSPHFWEILSKRAPDDVCGYSGAKHIENSQYTLRCLNELWRVDADKREVMKIDGVFGGEWDRQIPFLMMFYMASTGEMAQTGNMVGTMELYRGVDPFRERYRVNTDEFESVFGSKSEAFREVAAKLGATKLDQADISYRFNVFPKLPVDFLLWLADDEFPARLTLLFDKGSSEYYTPDVMAITVNLLIQRMLLLIQG